MVTQRNTAEVFLGAVTKQFKQGMDDARRSMSKLGDASVKMGDKMKQAGAVAGRAFTIGAAAAAAGAAKLAVDYDEARAVIQRGTGATKEEMEGLLEVWENVTKEGSEGWEITARAVAGAATIMTGSLPEIESATESLLDLSRSLGASDPAGVVEGMARAANLFGVSTAELPAVADAVYASVQGTGISIDELLGVLRTYSGVISGLGFEMTEAADLFGQMSRAGAKVERVIPGLTQFATKLKQVSSLEDEDSLLRFLDTLPEELRGAFKAFAEGGAEPIDVLSQIQEAIVNAKDETEAMGISIAAFGTEAGGAVAGAFRSATGVDLGINADDLLAQFEGSLDEVEPTMNERLRELSNELKLTALPLVNSFLESLTTKLEDEDARMESAGKAIVGAIVGGLVLGPAGAKIGAFAGVFGDEIEGKLDEEMTKRFGVEQKGGKTSNIIVGGVLAAVTLGLTGNPALAAAAGTFGATFGDDIVGGITQGWNAAFPFLKSAWNSHWNIFREPIEFIVNIFKGEWGAAFENVKGMISDYVARWKDVFAVALKVFKWIWNSEFMAPIRNAWETTISALKTAWDWLWDKIGPVVKIYIEAFKKYFEILWVSWEVMIGVIKTAWDTGWAVISAVIDGFKLTWDTIVSGIQWGWNTMVNIISAAWSGAVTGFTTVFQTYKGIFDGIIDGVEKGWDEMTKAITKAIEVADSIITPIINGIKAAWDAVTSAINAVVSAIEAVISAAQRAADAVSSIPNPGELVDKITPWDGVIPGFHSGGTFVAPRGQEGLARLQHGERIIPATHSSPNSPISGGRPIQVEVMLDTQTLVHALETYSDNVGPIRIAVA